jgi:hypothetical protein
MKQSSDLPQGYRVTVAELGGDEFDEQEEIQIGFQKRAFQSSFQAKSGSLKQKFGHRDSL